jgi:hypothetical protein
MADFDSRLPVRGLATDLTTEVANAAGATINPVEEFPQGSVTTGQNGPLMQGAVTTTSPVYVTGQTDPLSLTPTGALRVTVVDTSGVTEQVDYNTASSIAPNATSTHTFTPVGTVNIDAFNFAASGQMKVEIQVGGVSKFVYFTSKSELSYELPLINPIITAAVITLIRTNTDKQAMDVYSSVQWHA